MHWGVPRGGSAGVGERGFLFPPLHSLLAPLPDPKIHKEHTLKKNTYLGGLLPTRAAQKEYSTDLSSQNGSKMESQMEPTRQRPTLTKHAPA